MLVPVRDNEGRRFTESAWRELQRRLMAEFDGYTRRTGVVGAWAAGGQVYRDTSREYTVVITSWEQLPAWLSIVRWARERFRQEAIYIEVAGVPEILGRAEGEHNPCGYLPAVFPANALQYA